MTHVPNPHRRSMKTKLTEMLGIELPIIMAPMFLVTNTKMIVAAAENGIAGCIPALNFRTIEELEAGIKEVKSQTNKPFGVNLIVNKSNILAKKQLYKCLDLGVNFFITSLGSPEEVIRESKKQGIKVFCDVIEETYAKKVEDLGADGIIAVNSGAGGHLGNIPASALIPSLKSVCKIPVISAGGVGTGAGVVSMLALGADGLSIGSPFIATNESPVSQEYKDACVKYGAHDIVVTTKLSGSRCTVINTPYVQKIGTEQNIVEEILNKNKQLKKYAKMITYYKGMKALEKAAFSASYKTLWVAGSSIEFTKKIEPVKDVVTRIRQEMKDAQEQINKVMG
ncbi:NAD(P)H-dependent flavin oxidoreductase [Peredibacter sp. HCB2-198]|uniref:NAD(P)H-dependent flavin oxidoreductase n=1 Tax=Peredibacter sp. HCB2-198 TaxID=3383025 RepID=UPI0038B68D1A